MNQVNLKPDWSEPAREFPMFAQEAGLVAYSRASTMFGDAAYRQAADRIYGFLRDTMAAPGGGFYQLNLANVENMVGSAGDDNITLVNDASGLAVPPVVQVQLLAPSCDRMATVPLVIMVPIPLAFIVAVIVTFVTSPVMTIEAVYLPAVVATISVVEVGMMPLSDRYSAIGVLLAPINITDSDTWERAMYSWYAGMATAARMPMIATTIISSIRVKPFCSCFI